MKRSLLGRPIGRAALFLRDKFGLLMGAHLSVEAVGTLANDQLATTLITRICGSHRTFIDVGAHIGSIIAQVRHYDRSIKIVAIEAIPAKAQDLRRRFPFVELHGCAVGETTGEIAFFIDIRQSGYSSLATPIETEKKYKREIVTTHALTLPREPADA